MLVGHGDDGYSHHSAIAADFSTNVWYGGAPEGLKDHLFSRWYKIQQYPEVLGEGLIRKIADHYDFEPAHILVANGSTESIYLIAQAFRGHRTTILNPCFSEYEDACRLHDHQLSYMPWGDLHQEMILDTDLLFICNPNNPTGEIFLGLPQLIVQNPHVLFVLDEAFIEFNFALSSLIHLAVLYENLIVMRSMTKAYAIPGLRLGYIAASAKLISHLKALKLPWTVNAMALEAGSYIFEHFEELKLPVQALLKDKDDFITALNSLSRPQLIPNMCSRTHFFLAETTEGNAAVLKQFLLQEFNILIRDASNFRGLNNRTVRLATLSTEKNQLLINALASWNTQ